MPGETSTEEPKKKKGGFTAESAKAAREARERKKSGGSGGVLLAVGITLGVVALAVGAAFLFRDTVIDDAPARELH